MIGLIAQSKNKANLWVVFPVQLNTKACVGFRACVFFLVRGNKVSVQDGKTKSEGGYWEFFFFCQLSCLSAHTADLSPSRAISYVFFTASFSATPFFRRSVISHCHGSNSPLFCGRRSLFISFILPVCFRARCSDATTFTDGSIIKRVGLIFAFAFFFSIFMSITTCNCERGVQMGQTSDAVSRL